MTAQQQEITEKTSGVDAKKYRCGHCGTEYGHELLTRVHITRSEDANHENIDGKMPESEIEVLNADGDVIGTLNEPTGSVDFQSLTVDDLPDDLTEQHKRIVLAAAYNPYETNYSNLEDEAEKLLERDAYDVPSYSTVRRVIRQFFRPHEEGQTKQKAQEAEAEEDERLLSDLTTKQQAILVAKYANPSETKKKISDRVDSAKSYPGQVERDKGPEVDARLDQKINEQGMPVAKAVLAELEPEDLDQLEEEAEAEGWDLGIDLRSAVDEEGDVFDLGVDEQQKAMSASPFEADQPEAEADTGTVETWGDAKATATTASTEAEETEASGIEQEEVVEPEEPETTATSTAEAESEGADEEPEAEELEVQVEAEPEAEEVAAVEATGDTIPRKEVESLLDKVNFARRATENGEDEKPDERQTVLKVVEEDIEEILSE